jgi:NitT/TauT family transport system substrate-binding protein
VDALCNTDPVMTMLEQKGELRVVLDTRTLKGTAQLFGGPMPSGCLYAPVAFLEKNPQTAQALANGIVRSLKWLQTAGPSDIVRSVPDAYLLGDRALYLATFNKVHEAFSVDGLISEEGAKVALKALASFDTAVKADKIDLSRTYTNAFARKAKDRFKA